jgi:hypothetical protein
MQRTRLARGGCVNYTFLHGAARNEPPKAAGARRHMYRLWYATELDLLDGNNR